MSATSASSATIEPGLHGQADPEAPPPLERGLLHAGAQEAAASPALLTGLVSNAPTRAAFAAADYGDHQPAGEAHVTGRIV